jgi:hypothetical protein
MALQAYLNQESVDGIIPLHQLLRSDVKWRQCGAEPFAVPPNELWPNMVPTLTLLRDEVQPVIGKLSAQSVFRDAKINRCIKGAKRKRRKDEYGPRHL